MDPVTVVRVGGCASVSNCEGVRRVDPRDEGVAEVALRRWRIVLRLGRYATTRDGAADICKIKSCDTTELEMKTGVHPTSTGLYMTSETTDSNKFIYVVKQKIIYFYN